MDNGFFLLPTASAELASWHQRKSADPTAAIFSAQLDRHPECQSGTRLLCVKDSLAVLEGPFVPHPHVTCSSLPPSSQRTVRGRRERRSGKGAGRASPRCVQGVSKGVYRRGLQRSPPPKLKKWGGMGARRTLAEGWEMLLKEGVFLKGRKGNEVAKRRFG